MYITDLRSSAGAMKKDCVSGTLKKKPNASSIPRALSWLNFTSLTRPSGQPFRSDGELASVCVHRDDVDNWRSTAQRGNAVSNLDEESRWTVHYKSSWHQQENVFLPSSRSPCVEDLHRQAKVNLKTVLRDCDKLRKDGLRSSQYYSQAPLFSSTSSPLSGNCLDEEEDQEQAPTVSSADEEKLFHSWRPKTPVPGDLCEIDVQTNWTKALPLPTPEERMRQQAQAIQTDVIPINVTGESFDRQAGNRRSLVHSDIPLRRPTKIKRRKTITGLPEAIQKELGTRQTPVRGPSTMLPGQFSTMSRLESSRSNRTRSTTRDSSCQTEEIKVVPPSVRRIRAQKGQGIAAQLSSSSGNMSTVAGDSGATRARQELLFHSLPRQGARVSLLDCGARSVSRLEDSSGTLPRRLGTSENQTKPSLLPRPKSQEIREHQATGGVSPAASPRAPHTSHPGLSPAAEAVPPGKARAWAPPAPSREEHCSSSGNWSGSSGEDGGSARQSPTSDTAPPPSRSDSAVCLAPGPGTPAPRSLSAPPPASWVDPDPEAPPPSPAGSRGPPGETTLFRSISLRKSKKPPLPPARTDSLRRKPKGGCPALSPSLIASLQRSLEGSLAGGGEEEEGEGGEPGPWLMRARSQSSSNSSGRSTGGSQAYSTGAATPSQSETSSLRSECGDPWSYYTRGGGGGPEAGACDSVPPPKPESLWPDKWLGVTSPSSGYSSQCNTPTGAGPPRRPSPRPAKAKPRVPERKSSLRSSLSASSSSASLSSSTSESRPQPPAAPSDAPPASPGGTYLQQPCPATIPAAPTLPGVPLTAPPMHLLSPPLSGIPLPAPPMHHLSPPLSGIPLPAPPMHHLSPPLSGIPLPAPPMHRLSPPPNLPLPMSPPPTPPVLVLPPPTVPLPCSPPPNLPLPALPSPTLPVPTSPPPPPPLFVSPLPTSLLPAPPLPTSPPPPPPPALGTPPATHPLPTSPNLPLPPAPPLPTSLLPPPAPPLPQSPPPSASFPPPPPLDLKALHGGKRPPHLPAPSCREDPKSPGCQGEVWGAPRGLPLITADALRTVQLRSARAGGRADRPKAGEAQHKPAVLQRPSYLQSPAKHPHSTGTLAGKAMAAPSTDLAHSEGTTGSASEPEAPALSNTAQATVKRELVPTPELLPYSPGSTDQRSPGTGNGPEQDPEGVRTPDKSKPPGRTPPPIARKPKLSLLVPPAPWDFTAHERLPPDSSRSAAKAASPTAPAGGEQSPTRGTERSSSRPAGGSEGALRPRVWGADQREEDTALEDGQDKPEMQEEQAIDSSPMWDHLDGGSATSSQENNIDDVFEDSSANLSSNCGDSSEQPSTPTRPRTTEDLFAAIHRSKRRVLGRKDSEDEFSRTQPPSSPVTPTGAVPSPGSLRQAGSIQRSLRKSTTSSDSFKALLLKKGSRPEQGGRMSAAEMLKSSDPRHRPAEPERPGGRPAGQRGRNPREEWASHEGPMPKGAGLGVRYGRSRTPPSAASSRYGARLHLHRLHSSPMTVIREAEAWEASESLWPREEARRHSEGDVTAVSGQEEELKSNDITPREDWDPVTSSSRATAQGAAILTAGGANQDWDS